MAKQRKGGISWTDQTWNPVTGCTKVSPGCAHCYAERQTERFQGAGSFEKIVLHPERLGQPLHWKKPRRIFVNSMSDLFHEDVPSEFIAAVFGAMIRSPQHTFQILTKRPERMRKWFESMSHCPLGTCLSSIEVAWPGAFEKAVVACWPLFNVWLGVSVENQHFADERIPLLLDTPAAVRFISAEPLLSSLDLSKWLYDKSRDCFLGAGSIGMVHGRREVGTDIEKHRMDRRTSTVDEMDFYEARRAQRVPERLISADTVSIKRTETESFRPPNRVDSGEQEAHSSRDGDKSQGLRQAEQQELQPGDCHKERERSSRYTNKGTQGQGPGWFAECDGESNRDASYGNSLLMGIEGNDATPIGRNVWTYPECDSYDSNPQELVSPSLSWVICGGESGPGARPMQIEWARSLRDQCKDAGVPFFFKQVGNNAMVAGIQLPVRGKGGDFSDIPPDLCVREFPQAAGVEAVRK